MLSLSGRRRPKANHTRDIGDSLYSPATVIPSTRKVGTSTPR